ncbi:MAG: hypothetical protein Q9227_000568 [Pyrenula ochraceoflavens]
MNNFKGVMKDGWHPKGKDGGKESWRGDFKGINQVAGWVGKGKDPNKAQQEEHISRPLASLKDPSAFGPPPKNVNYHGGAAVPDRITPDRRGLGAPLSSTQVQSQARAAEAREEAEKEISEKPAPPPAPYKMDTTGLSTKNLLPPPTHHAVKDNETSLSPGQSTPSKPKLPPRLPPRKSASSGSDPGSAPPSYESIASTPESQSQHTTGFVNQSAVSRLGKAGVNVSGLGIGQQSNPWKNERSQSSTSNASDKPQFNELQSRFAQMKRPSSQENASSPASEGTTFAQKQQALQTAQNFQKDPSSVSLADAKSAASTANNFRERHNEQITAGAQRANSWNKKYNITGRMNNFLEKQSSPTNDAPNQSSTPTNMEAYGRKPPPPPVPNKKPDMHASQQGVQSPPPVPLGTKPR